MRLVVTYDISDDSNRRRVYRTLQSYGAWRQYSVFEVKVTKAERVEMEDKLDAQIDESDGDRVRTYRICGSCRNHIHDIGLAPPDDQSNVI